MDDQQFQDKMGDLWEQAKQLKASSLENPNGLTEKMLKCSYIMEGDEALETNNTAADRKSVTSNTDIAEKPAGMLFLTIRSSSPVRYKKEHRSKD